MHTLYILQRLTLLVVNILLPTLLLVLAAPCTGVAGAIFFVLDPPEPPDPFQAAIITDIDLQWNPEHNFYLNFYHDELDIGYYSGYFLAINLPPDPTNSTHVMQWNPYMEPIDNMQSTAYYTINRTQHSKRLWRLLKIHELVQHAHCYSPMMSHPTSWNVLHFATTANRGMWNCLLGKLIELSGRYLDMFHDRFIDLLYIIRFLYYDTCNDAFYTLKVFITDITNYTGYISNLLADFMLRLTMYTFDFDFRSLLIKLYTLFSKYDLGESRTRDLVDGSGQQWHCAMLTTLDLISYNINNMLPMFNILLSFATVFSVRTYAAATNLINFISILEPSVSLTSLSSSVSLSPTHISVCGPSSNSVPLGVAVLVSLTFMFILLLPLIRRGVVVHIHYHNHSQVHLTPDQTINLNKLFETGYSDVNMKSDLENISPSKIDSSMQNLCSLPIQFSSSYLNRGFSVYHASQKGNTDSVTDNTDTEDEDDNVSDKGTMSDGGLPTSTKSKFKTNLQVPEHSRTRHISMSPVLSPREKIKRRLKTRSDSESSTCSLLSVPGKLEDIKQTKSDRSKWIYEDGCYTLDQENSCHLSYLRDFISTEECDELLSVLPQLIRDNCTEVKSPFQASFGPSSDKDIISETPKKWSTCHSDINNGNELNTLISSYKDKVQKSIDSIFDIKTEFDCIVVNHLSSKKDSMQYESFHEMDDPEISPTVAVLTVGSTRAMYLKPKNHNSITHRLSLFPGTLCVFSGQTEQKYRHSLPKNFGEKEQMTIFFIEKACRDSTTANLSTQDSTKAFSDTDTIVEKDIQKPIPNTCVKNVPSDRLLTVPPIKTSSPVEKLDGDDPLQNPKGLPPACVLKRSSNVKCPSEDDTIIQVVDNEDFEDDNELILSLSLKSAIKAMTETCIDLELKRHSLSTAGSLKTKRSRLFISLTMKLGGMKSHNNNHELIKMESIESITRRDVDALSLTQQLIEENMVKIADDLSSVKTQITDIRSLNIVSETRSKSHSPKTDKPTSSTNHIVDCYTQIKAFRAEIEALKSELSEVKSTFNVVREAVSSSIKDIKSWYKSAFFHEDSSKISEIHRILTKSEQFQTQIPEANTEQPIGTEKTSSIPILKNRVNVIHQEEKEAFDDHIPIRTFADCVKENKTPIVCLITDSIMRHITRDDVKLDSYHFCRIDRTDSFGLTHPSFLSRVKHLKPHLLYIHLGINDIQANIDSQTTLNNFSKFDKFICTNLPRCKLVYSLPLLTGKTTIDQKVYSLCKNMSMYITDTNSRVTQFGQQRITQFNRNFSQLSESVKRRPNGLPTEDPRNFVQVPRMFSVDKLHLSEYGKMVIAGNIRHTLYSLRRNIISDLHS